MKDVSSSRQNFVLATPNLPCYILVTMFRRCNIEVYWNDPPAATNRIAGNPGASSTTRPVQSENHGVCSQPGRRRSPLRKAGWHWRQTGPNGNTSVDRRAGVLTCFGRNVDRTNRNIE